MGTQNGHNVPFLKSASLKERKRKVMKRIKHVYKQVKPIGFKAPRGGAYNNRKHLKLETPCSKSAKLRQ